MEYYTDPLTGRQYYVDPATGHSRWVEPPTDRTGAEPTQLQPQVQPQEPTRLQPQVQPQEHAWAQPQDRAGAQPHPHQQPRPTGGRRLGTGAKVALGGAGLLTILAFLVAVALASPQVQTIQPLGDTPTGTEGTLPTAVPSTTPTPSAATSPATPSSAAPKKASSSSAPKKAPSTTRKPSAATTPESTTSASSCDPNYSGGCVPIASDVDCAGGGGNGPAYVEGPITVVGRDVYKLDRDGDGTACE